MASYITNKELVKAFKDLGLTPQIKVGQWLNIARPDGAHCEFYPNDKTNYVFTANYTINGSEKDLYFCMPHDLDQFVETVCKILEYVPLKKNNIKVYDNGGKTLDRYTVVFLDQPERQKGVYACLGMSENPFTGFGQHGTAMQGRQLGKRIKFEELPINCQKLVTTLRQDLESEG